MGRHNGAEVASIIQAESGTAPGTRSEPLQLDEVRVLHFHVGMHAGDYHRVSRADQAPAGELLLELPHHEPLGRRYQGRHATVERQAASDPPRFAVTA